MARGEATGGKAGPGQLAANVEQVEVTDAATQVVFKFPRTVSVDNGRTLSIPVVDRQVPAQRLALFQSDTPARNPMAALRLINDGETGLPPVNEPGISQEEVQRRLKLYNTRIDFGSKVLFQPELNLGYRFNDPLPCQQDLGIGDSCQLEQV